MGNSRGARCRECGAEFEVNEGGGFFFHLLHCNRCGTEKSVGFEKIADIHARYVKGLTGPWCVATMDHDQAVQADDSIVPMSAKEYHKAVEAAAGKCRCGGAFRLKARPRCPRCHSTRLELLEATLFYD